MGAGHKPRTGCDAHAPLIASGADPPERGTVFVGGSHTGSHEYRKEHVMTVTMYTADGTPDAGDEVISDRMRAYCDRVGGFIRDDVSGELLHDARHKHD